METHVTEDKYQLERREAYMDRNKEDFKYYVLAGLAEESDLHDQVMENLEKNIEGLTKERFEKDTEHYKMNRLCAD